MTFRKLLVAAPLVIAALALNACGSGNERKPGTAGAEPLRVVASFYPLQFATEQIGGGHVAVTSLTKPGAEPHDIELTPQDVATVSKATLVGDPGAPVALARPLASLDREPENPRSASL